MIHDTQSAQISQKHDMYKYINIKYLQTFMFINIYNGLHKKEKEEWVKETKHRVHRTWNSALLNIV